MRKIRWIVGVVGVLVLIGIGLLIAFLIWRNSRTSLGVQVPNIDTSTIAFIQYPDEMRGTGDVYLFSERNGTLTQLTVNNRFQYLTWATDGVNLILEDKDRNHSLLNATTGELKPTRTLNPATNFAVLSPDDKVLSPDGKLMLSSTEWSCCQGGDRLIKSQIAVANADGSNSHNLSNGGSPTWSPDSSQVAFAAQLDGDAETEIYVINSDGSSLHRLIANPGWDSNPVWSPDGKTLFFIGVTYNPSYDSVQNVTLFTVHADGQSLTNLGDIVYRFSFPQWSPDSKWITYTKDMGGAVKRVQPDGSGSDSSLGEGSYPALSMDSLEVAYVNARFGRDSQKLCISVIRQISGVDWGSPICIPGTANSAYPAWKPLSKR